MTDLATRKMELEARLVVLAGRMAGIEDELDGPHAQDWEELAVEREGDEVLEEMGLSGQAEVRRIQAALARIAAGTYGICAKCGAEIGDARLNAVPEGPLCRTCAGAR